MCIVGNVEIRFQKTNGFKDWCSSEIWNLRSNVSSGGFLSGKDLI